MITYPIFQEIINEIRARPDADPVGILEEYVTPLVDVCNQVNQWIGERPVFDFSNEPPWYEKFAVELARYDVDLSPRLPQSWTAPQLDPYEAFETWCEENGYADVMDSDVNETDSARLAEAIERYWEAR